MTRATNDRQRRLETLRRCNTDELERQARHLTALALDLWAVLGERGVDCRIPEAAPLVAPGRSGGLAIVPLPRVAPDPGDVPALRLYPRHS